MKIKVVTIDFEIPPRVKKWGLRVGLPVALLLGGGAIAWANTKTYWNTGDVLAASDLNGLQDQLTVPGYAPRAPSSFRANATTLINVPSGVSTPIVFDKVEYDVLTEYDPVGGAFTAQSAGVYLISCGLWFFASGTAAVWSAQLMYKNGAYELDGTDVNSSGVGAVRPFVTSLIPLAAGDSVTCRAYQTSGATQQLGQPSERNVFSAIRIY